MTDEYELVADEPGFSHAISKISKARRIGLDLESNGFFRYPEQVCLVQISTPRDVFVIDPLALEDMKPLGSVLATRKVETVLHAGSHDVLSLDRDWGMHIENMFDTNIAAAFVGMSRLGLANVLEEELGVDIPKEKRIQRSDWSNRPLSQKALDYAANDVRYLHELREALGKRLRKLGREDWVKEECQRLSATRYDPPDPDMAVFNVKGWRSLDDQGLAILQSLVDFREDHAVRMGRPHFRVIPDMALITLADKPNSDLSRVRGLGNFSRGSMARGIRKAIAEGQSSKPPKRPAQPRQPRIPRGQREAFSSRLAKLKQWRIARGKDLSLDPALIWPMRSLQRIARAPDKLESEMQDPDVRRWQRKEFGKSLRRALA
ncbi:MAG: hypothetical protein J4G14_06615 [Dehalococcoidia bacterium]|nr:hypothetical protein [Dehalococcoidia bacterium]